MAWSTDVAIHMCPSAVAVVVLLLLTSSNGQTYPGILQSTNLLNDILSGTGNIDALTGIPVTETFRHNNGKRAIEIDITQGSHGDMIDKPDSLMSKVRQASVMLQPMGGGADGRSMMNGGFGGLANQLMINQQRNLQINQQKNNQILLNQQRNNQLIQNQQLNNQLLINQQNNQLKLNAVNQQLNAVKNQLTAANNKLNPVTNQFNAVGQHLNILGGQQTMAGNGLQMMAG